MRYGKRWARLLAAVLVLAMLLPAMAVAASYPYETISMDDVNLRKRANTTSTVLKRIKAGDSVTVLGVSGSFYKVEFEDKTGYAMKKFIDGTDPSPDPTPNAGLTMQAPPAVTEYPYDTTLIDRVKLRKTAKPEGEVIRTLLPDSVVTVYALTDNGFAKIKHEGKTGYALATHINLANIPGPAPKPTATPKPGSEKYAALEKGAKGEAVEALQSALAELGYLQETDVDGKFGAKTESALKVFQKRNGLTKNGVADAELQLLMYEGTPKDERGYRQYVKTVAPVAGALIRENSRGDSVRRAQERLRELGYYAGEIGKVCTADTVGAIKMFEGKHGLVADGELSAEDQALLYSARAMEATSVTTPEPAPTPAPPTRTLRRGDQGEDVKTVQERLKELGYYDGNITGTYNEGTEDGVSEFQRRNKLDDDGVLGPISRTVLFGRNPIYAVPTAVPPVTENSTPAPITEENVIIIRAGSMGDAVLRLQKRLEELGYYTSRQDGVYLTDDMEAVRAFQRANGLKVDGKAGFQTQSLLYSDSAVLGNGSDVPTDTPVVTVLRYGSEGAEVTTLQNRLISLGYLVGSADGKFGRDTKKAVIAFQKANSLSADGVAGSDTMNALNDPDADANKVPTNTTLRVGTISDAVRDMQNRLITLGYLSGKADGNFGLKTSLALIAFQKNNNLAADGVAGYKTLTRLNSTKAVSANGDQSDTVTSRPPDVTSGSISASQVRYANWYTEGRARCRQFPNATVYDFTSGISWQVNMFSLGAHADAEPLTPQDTANMNRAFGGKTTWTPKPVWVVLSDGTVYMASTHNTPHDPYHIKDNNFKGHICIHFPRTMAQVERIGPYATKHQKTIDLGWEATLKRAW